MAMLGGHALFLGPQDIQLGVNESLKVRREGGMGKEGRRGGGPIDSLDRSRDMVSGYWNPLHLDGRTRVYLPHTPIHHTTPDTHKLHHHQPCPTPLQHHTTQNTNHTKNQGHGACPGAL